MRTDHALYNILKKTGFANKEFLRRRIDECSMFGILVVNPLKLTNDANELLHWYKEHNYLKLIKTEKISSGLLYYYKKARYF